MLKKLFFALVILTVAVSARRISKHRALAQDPRSDLEGASAAISSAAPLKYDAIRKIFNDNFIRIAKDQNKPVKRVIGTYESVGVRRTCSNGNCGDFSADIQYTNGAKGVVTAILNPAANGKAESIDITFNYYWPSCTTQTECMIHLTCLNVGQADTTPCEWSTYQEAYKPSAYGSGRDLYNSAPKLSKGDSKMKQNAIRITAKGLLVVREYYEDDVRSLIHTIRHIRGTYAADAFVPATAGADGDYVKQLNPDVANMFAAVKKAKVLTTEQIIRKFFTQDNIDIALMQSASTPVKKAIGAYQTGYFVKTCDSGVCGAWSQVNLVSADQFGGEGSITLSCTISDPKDLSKSKCDVSMTMKGGYGWEYQTFAVCPAVGNAVSKCNGIQSGPSYFRLKKDSSTGRTFWDRANFVRDVVEADEFYFTDSQLVARWKWHGLSKGDSYAYGRLVYSELITYSTPFSDFANSDKTNCLSKATADQILANAQQKKNLKNKIVLQKKPLEDLVKGAPYKSIDEAIVKISGIGPVNVVYVSFWYNFFC